MVSTKFKVLAPTMVSSTLFALVIFLTSCGGSLASSSLGQPSTLGTGGLQSTGSPGSGTSSDTNVGSGSNPADTQVGFLYAINGGLGTTGGVVKGATITPVPGSPFDAIGEWSNFISTDQKGRFLIEGAHSVANLGPSSFANAYLSSYKINAQTGELEKAPGSPLQIPFTINAGVVDPSGHFVYIPRAPLYGGGLDVYVIDQSSGALTHVPGAPYPGPTASPWVQINPSGTFLFEITPPMTPGGKAQIVVWRLHDDGSQPVPVEGSPFSFDFGASPAAVTSDGRFLLTAGGGQVSTFGISSQGIPTLVSQTQIDRNDSSGIAIHPKNRFVYVWGGTQNVISALTLDNAGHTAPIAGGAVPSDDGDLTIDPTGHYLYATDAGTLVFSIDQNTGRLTELLSSSVVSGYPSVFIAPNH